MAAFTDSTVFSNFCTFEPGKSELMMGMLEWLNHRDGPQPAALVVRRLRGPVGAGLWVAREWQGAWILLVAAGLLGWTSAALGSRECTGKPSIAQVKPPRPLRHRGDGLHRLRRPAVRRRLHRRKGRRFGIFRRWILRLGYFTSPRLAAVVPTGVPDNFSGNLLVLVYPNRPLPAGFGELMEEYVRNGGKVLVVDSPENTESTANELLEPFGLSLDASSPRSGACDACKVAGSPGHAGGGRRRGRAVRVAGRKTGGASVAYGRGSVTVVGFGSRFSDPNMGVTGDVVPKADMRAVYEVQFYVLRTIMERTPPGVSRRRSSSCGQIWQ